MRKFLVIVVLVSSVFAAAPSDAREVVRDRERTFDRIIRKVLTAIRPVTVAPKDDAVTGPRP